MFKIDKWISSLWNDPYDSWTKSQVWDQIPSVGGELKSSMGGFKWLMKKGKDASSLVESGLELAPFHRYLSLL